MRLCLERYRASVDLKQHVGAELDMVQELNAELLAYDAVLEDAQRHVSVAVGDTDDDTEHGGGGSGGGGGIKRRKVDHTYSSVWERVLSGLLGGDSQGYWVLSIPHIVSPRQELAAFVPEWEAVTTHHTEACPDVLAQASHMFMALVDSRKLDVALHFFATFSALLTVQQRHGGSKWPSWDAIVDKTLSTLDMALSGSAFSSKALSFLVRYVLTLPCVSSPCK